jgi:uncharacterized membrane protein YdjX (TVP38/TMEM64 family)
MEYKIKWIFIIALIFLLILIPYLLFGESFEKSTAYLLNYSPHNLVLGLAIGGLLTIDILVPVPSSIISTAGGYFLGFEIGTLVSFIGMTLNCIIGYLLGSKIVNPISKKFVGASEISKLEILQKKYGDWIIIISRAVPVLAESSIFMAGIGRMPLNRFILMILFSNLGVSIVYSFIGAYSAHLNSFLLAFAGSIILPVIVTYLKNKI